MNSDMNAYSKQGWHRLDDKMLGLDGQRFRVRLKLKWGFLWVASVSSADYRCRRFALTIPAVVRKIHDALAFLERVRERDIAKSRRKLDKRSRWVASVIGELDRIERERSEQ